MSNEEQYCLQEQFVEVQRALQQIDEWGDSFCTSEDVIAAVCKMISVESSSLVVHRLVFERPEVATALLEELIYYKSKEVI